MDNASYVALSRQMTLQRELDITANNIANMDTPGFKLESLIVKAEPAAPARTEQLVDPAVFSIENGVARDFRQGAMKKTDNPLDLAIEGAHDFFVVQTPDGPRYTRDGQFTVDAQGRIVTAQGMPLQGDGGDITLDPTKGTPNISADGIITQGVGQNATRVGKIQIAEFPTLSTLSKTGDNLYTADGAAPGAPTTGTIRQGYLESSNVNSIAEITRLITVSRSYDQVSQILDTTYNMSKEGIERLGKAA